MTSSQLVFLFLSQAVPDPALTPGKTDPAVTTETVASMICRHGYTAKVRSVTEAEKRQVVAEYKAAHPDWPEPPYEIDHLISLELGGSNDTANLWPQPYCPLPRQPSCLGAREKDVVETEFHRRICAGTLSLDDARLRIVQDWISAYNSIQAAKALPK